MRRLLVLTCACLAVTGCSGDDSGPVFVDDNVVTPTIAPETLPSIPLVTSTTTAP